MARTAPIPNFPAIPGMNPGVFVMGGGGGSGGGKGKNGKGKKGKQGAKGKGKGKNAKGGGKNANKCGAGSGGGCPNPSHGNKGTHAGDPIDPSSGRVYTIAQTDAVLSGPIVLPIQRAWSSAGRRRDVGMGPGWMHTLATGITAHRRTMRLVGVDHEDHVLDIPASGESVRLHAGVVLRRQGDLFALERDGLYFVFAPAENTTRWRLAAVLDQSGNRITMHYAGGRLVGGNDSAGRPFRVLWEKNRIEGFEVGARDDAPGEVMRRYEYDDAGDLVSAVDPLGRRVRYAYRDHAMVRIELACGTQTHFRYDDANRGIETWIDRPGGVADALADGVPTVLADGITPAKGMLHVRVEYGPDFSMVYDSRQAKRLDVTDSGRLSATSGVAYEQLEYDEHDEVATYADGEGGVTTFERNDAGQLVRVTSADGATWAYAYDETGGLVGATDPTGSNVGYRLDDRGRTLETFDELGTLLSFAYDARGMRSSATLPDGATTRFDHDQFANLVRLVEPNGYTRSYRHDVLGRIVGVVDGQGRAASFRYDRAGQLIEVQTPSGGVTQASYDESGRLVAYVAEDGRTFRLTWGGSNVVTSLTHPTGERVDFRYDREGQLLEVRNVHGDRHVFERDAGGRIVAETRFDGRRYTYALDATGRPTRVVNGAGESTAIERDANGRVTRRGYDDETEDAFGYDPVGRLARAANGATDVDYVYDARGNLVREVQRVGEDAISVSYTWDLAGRLTSVGTTPARTTRFVRDVMGQTTRVDLGPGTGIERTLDELGREVVRTLPAGGEVIARYDASSALVERRVVSATTATAARPSIGQGDPAWIGELPPGTTLFEGYAYDAGGDLSEAVSSVGTRRLIVGYDAGKRVTSLARDGVETRYDYGPNGLPSRRDLPVAHDKAGAPITTPTSTFEYDAECRRTARVERATGLRDRYTWTASGLLAAVDRIDGTRISFAYDATGRRLLKRVTTADGAITDTRFVWAGGLLLEEHVSRHTAAGPQLDRVVRYAYDGTDDPETARPIAQQTSPARSGQIEEGPWLHYLLGPGAIPVALLSGDGAVYRRIELSLWGDFDDAEIPFRFPGQYYDRETGLAYNRYRYYDPGLGTYVNADPIGVAGGLSPFQYVHAQPWRNQDVTGLVSSTISGHGSRGTGHSGSGGELHDIVKQALPPMADDRYPAYQEGSGPPPGRNPAECAEPQAMSRYIRDWEKKNNGGKPLDPNNPKDAKKIRKCLGDINNITANEDGGAARAACPNCSQMFQNLRDRWGAPKEKFIQPGHVTGHHLPGGSQAIQRTEPPNTRWAEGMR